MTKERLTGPFIKSNTTANKIMNNIIITLIPLIILNIIKEGIKPLLTIIIAIIFIITTEYIYNSITKNKKKLYSIIKEKNNIIQSIILSLIVSSTTPIYTIIIASIITSVTKILNKNFDYQLNPLILGIIYILIFNNKIDSFQDIKIINIIELILYFIIYIYLCYKKTIKWQISFYFFTTVILASTFITLTNNFSTNYLINYTTSSTLIISAIFLATDSLTSPTTKYGRIIYGISLGIITIIFYYLIPIISITLSPIIAILIMNFLVKPIDNLSIQINFNKHCQKASIAILIIITIIITSIISYQL